MGVPLQFGLSMSLIWFKRLTAVKAFGLTGRMPEAAEGFYRVSTRSIRIGILPAYGRIKAHRRRLFSFYPRILYPHPKRGD